LGLKNYASAQLRFAHYFKREKQKKEKALAMSGQRGVGQGFGAKYDATKLLGDFAPNRKA
jgi:hypothetical protein